MRTNLIDHLRLSVASSLAALAGTDLSNQYISEVLSDLTLTQINELIDNDLAYYDGTGNPLLTAKGRNAAVQSFDFFSSLDNPTN